MFLQSVAAKRIKFSAMNAYLSPELAGRGAKMKTAALRPCLKT
jgi:hypothetical protein